MKKVLLAGVATLGLLATGAQAQEVSTSAPFKFTIYGAQTLFATAQLTKDKAVAGGQNSFALSTGNRINFKADGKADNGLTYGADIHFNASANQPGAGNLYDVSYGYIGGSFGKLSFGTLGGATDQLAVYQDGAYWAGTQNTPGIDGGIVCYGGSAFNLACNYGYLANEAGIDNKSTKLYYTSPSLSGLTIGISFAPDGTSRAGSQSIRSQVAGSGGTDYNQIEGALNYKTAIGSNGTINVAGAVGHSTSKQPTSGTRLQDNTSWAINGLVKFGGFEFGLGYGSDGKNGKPSGSSAKDTTGFEAWVDYGIGPWNVGGYFQHLDVSENATAIASRADIGEIGASYTIAKGVAVFTGLDFVTGRNNATSLVNQSSQMFYFGTAVSF